METELVAAKEHLQSVINEREVANEELRSANEEIQSSNEELQSTNEELETAKEELQREIQTNSVVNKPAIDPAQGCATAANAIVVSRPWIAGILSATDRQLA